MIGDILPPMVSPLSAGLLVTASFFTSGLTAAFGIGGGVALLAIMGFLLPVSALIPVHGVVQFGSNFGRSWLLREYLPWRLLAYFSAGAMLGAGLGAQFIIELPDALLKVILGVFVLVVTWVSIPAVRNAGARMFAAGGLITTFASMFVGASGPLVAATLEKTFAERQRVVATHAAAMTVQHATKVIAFGFVGFAFHEWAILIAAMIASGFAGTVLGGRMLQAMPERRFRFAFRLVMTALALSLLGRGLYAMGAGG